jgi:hypothetical protein
MYHSCDLGMSSCPLFLNLLISLLHLTLLITLSFLIISKLVSVFLALSWQGLNLSVLHNPVLHLGNYSSSPVSLSFRIPQGSVLGPLLFTIYTPSIVHICSNYSVNQQQYGDDTQLLSLSLYLCFSLPYLLPTSLA